MRPQRAPPGALIKGSEMTATLATINPLALPNTGSRPAKQRLAPPAPQAEPDSAAPTQIPGLDVPHTILGFVPFATTWHPTVGVALVRLNDDTDETRRYSVIDVLREGGHRLPYEGTMGGQWTGLLCAGGRWLSSFDPKNRSLVVVVEY